MSKIRLYNEDISQEPTLVCLTVDGSSIPTGVSLYSFISGMRRTLKMIAPALHFEPAYPDYIINYDETKFETAITWEVQTMAPTKLGGSPSKSPSIGTREIKPRLRSEVHVDGKYYQITGQFLDCFLRFVVWAKTASESEQVTQWFQSDFMNNFSRLFGSQQVYLYERSRDSELLKINNTLQTRSLEYYVLLEDYTAILTSTIQEIKVDIEAKDTLTNIMGHGNDT